jgi:outer membrane protein assembly factor BamB
MSVCELRFDDPIKPDISGAVQKIPLSGPLELPPAVSDSQGFVVMKSGRVHGVDLASGQEDWCVNLRDALQARPVTDGDSVLVGSVNNAVYSLDTADGSVRWNIKTDGQILAPPAVANNTLYVGDERGTVTAYR